MRRGLCLCGANTIYLPKIYMASHPLYLLYYLLSNGISLIIGSQIVGRLAKRIPEQTLLLSGLWLAIIASVAALVVTLAHGPLFALVIPLFFLRMLDRHYVYSGIPTCHGESSLRWPEVQQHYSGRSFSSGRACRLLLVGIAGEDTAVPLGYVC